MVNPFIPSRGDVVWLNFDPQQGHEQAGKRPALVLSPRSYNQKTGLLLACPITSKIKSYPFEVSIKVKNIDGVVLADQLKSLDWQARKASFVAAASGAVLNHTRELIEVLLSLKEAKID